MQANIHTPERLANEKYGAYQARRTKSNAATHSRGFHDSQRRGTYTNSDRQERKAAIAAAGGIRQYKRQRASDMHDLGRY